MNTAKNNGQAKGRNNNDKHEKIMRAAIKVFAKNGFHNSKISQIAKEAGVADGTIYLYFKNKDDILIKVFEERLGEINAMLNDQLNRLDNPVDELRFCIRGYLELFANNRALAEVIAVELRQSHKFMREYVPAKFAEYLNIISRVIREGKDKGVFRDNLLPGVIKRALFGALDELMVYLVMTTAPKYAIDTLVDQCSELFLRGLSA